MDMSSLYFIGAIIVLILVSAIFVATEFSIIRVRQSRIQQLINEGNKSATYVQQVLNNLDVYLSTCQLGITMTSILLGFIGEPTVESLLEPLFLHFGVGDKVASSISFAIAFIVITFIHVVVGELAPKTIAIQKAEILSLLLARPIIFFHKITLPIIWGMNTVSNAFVKSLGFKIVNDSGEQEAHSEEELKLLISESYENGLINQTEYQYVSNVFKLDEKMAKEAKVPRTDMLCIDINDSTDKIIETILREEYTRYPVIDKDKDCIIGIINSKKIFSEYIKDRNIDVRNFIQEDIKIIDTTPLKNVLKIMQKENSQMAILVDEFGGTSGLITTEDILEQIVGEIHDEFDADEEPMISEIATDKYLVNGKVTLTDLENLLNIKFYEEDIDTIGGWLSTKLLYTTFKNEFIYERVLFKVKEIDHLRIKKIEISLLEPDEENPS